MARIDTATKLHKTPPYHASADFPAAPKTGTYTQVKQAYALWAKRKRSTLEPVSWRRS